MENKHWLHASNFAVTVTTKRNPRFKGQAEDKVIAADEEFAILQEQANLKFRRNKFHVNWKWSMVVELTKSAEPHYHGIVTISTSLPSKYPIEFLNKSLNELTKETKHLGWVLVKPLDNWQVWLEYCKKDLKVTEDLLGLDPVRFNDAQFFDGRIERLLGVGSVSTNINIHNEYQSFGVTPDLNLNIS